MADDLGPHDLDIDLDTDDPTPQALYRWLLASVLFGRPVQQKVAADTYRVLIDHGLTSPAKFAEVGRERLRGMLDEGSYARIDYVMADELHEVMGRIDSEHGSVNRLVRASPDLPALRDALTAYKGVGPKTVEIFTRWLPEGLVGSEA
ncbi:HhH-GDP family DNA glycosylase [Frondihabitans cladoniiphilus]|uniref:DNA methylase n=1 Tax=Frondihabitans cladoniiphilus TaxID=715785 RepID=A0ABP8W4S2_9MICO